MQRISSATATKKGAPKKRGPVRSMSIQKAENGFTSNIDYEPSADAKDGERYGAHLSETNVHPSAEHLMEHVGKTFGAKAKKGKGAADGTPAHENAESKAEETAEQAAGDEDEEED
jgi:hypothetical protein